MRIFGIGVISRLACAIASTALLRVALTEVALCVTVTGGKATLLAALSISVFSVAIASFIVVAGLVASFAFIGIARLAPAVFTGLVAPLTIAFAAISVAL